MSSSYFLQKEDEDSLKKFKIQMTLPEKHWWKNIIIACAPVLGYLFWAYMIYWIPFKLIDADYLSILVLYLLILYFSLNFRLIGMSDGDKGCVRYSLEKMKEDKEDTK